MPKRKTATKNINKKLNKLNKNLNKIKASTARRRPLRTGKKTRSRRRNRNIFAAYTKSPNKDFRILYQDGNTVKVTGRDLVYKIPDDLVNNTGTDIITVIPANPCYWVGTRISALAQGYQNYRPLAFKVTYIPQCAVTQQGNVIAGTLWNQAPSINNLQQSLRTSNGGQLSQCYKPFTSVVRMKTNLQYNLYRTAGQFDQESNPFIYIAMAVACKDGDKSITPGYFYVTWSYLLKNPIGNTITFTNSGLTRYQQVDFNAENLSVVFINGGIAELPIGTILQIETIEDDTNAYYNGSQYKIQDNDLVWAFSNSATQFYMQLKHRMNYVFKYEQYYEPEQARTITAAAYVREELQDADNTDYYVGLFAEGGQMEVTLTPGYKYYVIEDGGFLEQNSPYIPLPVGEILRYDSYRYFFKLPKDFTILQQVGLNLQITNRRVTKKKQADDQVISEFFNMVEQQTKHQLLPSHSDPQYKSGVEKPAVKINMSKHAV